MKKIRTSFPLFLIILNSNFQKIFLALIEKYYLAIIKKLKFKNSMTKIKATTIYFCCFLENNYLKLEKL